MWVGKPPIGLKRKMAGHRSPQIMFRHNGEGGKIPLPHQNMSEGGCKVRAKVYGTWCHGTGRDQNMRWDGSSEGD